MNCAVRSEIMDEAVVEENIAIGSEVMGNMGECVAIGPDAVAAGECIVTGCWHDPVLPKCNVCSEECDSLFYYIRSDGAEINLCPKCLIENVIQFGKRSVKTFEGLCQICLQTEKPGFTWGDRTLCMDCMYDNALHFQAKQNWIDNHGDPVQELRQELAELKKQINDLQQIQRDCK